MPPVNHPLATVGVVALSVAVAAAIAVYESPELQRMAQDLRRRIAFAIHSFGDSISPEQRENLFNRPEDAEGFLMSRGLGPGSLSDHGVDADDDSRRRQREELMYWNAVMEGKQKERGADPEKEAAQPSRPVGALRQRGSSFDDFLKQDENAEKGAFVISSGSTHHGAAEGTLRRRGEGARGIIAASTYSNPFLDENAIDEHILLENSLVDDPVRDELSDIYSATDIGDKDVPMSSTISPAAVKEEDTKSDSEQQKTTNVPQATPLSFSTISESELGQDEYMTAGQDEDRHNEAYSSIQAWAQTSHPAFYSPLPVTPAAPLSEPDLISDGELTPTDTMSLAGSGIEVANDVASVRSGEAGRYYDVLSEDEEIMTPSSWSEVGSVTGESEGIPTRA
ncbi:hypothetical protein MN608_03503 [Microdochium nivale]|nr:hypothetical protein MN608_03503 [Microdochium nivale]